MKRFLTVSAAAVGLLAAGMPCAAGNDPLPDILVVNIGARNPAFKETKYSHLKFFYTPGMVVQADSQSTGKAVFNAISGGMARATIKGEPKFLESWWDTKDLRGHGLLFDKNGVVVWEGDVEGDDVLESEGEGIEETIEDAFKTVVKKGKTGEVDAKKKIDYAENEDELVLEMKVPAFDVVTSSGETKAFKSLVESGKPVFVVFVQISSDVDFSKVQDAAKNSKDEATKWKAEAEIRAMEHWVELLGGLEEELFDNKVKY